MNAFLSGPKAGVYTVSDSCWFFIRGGRFPDDLLSNRNLYHLAYIALNTSILVSVFALKSQLLKNLKPCLVDSSRGKPVFG